MMSALAVHSEAAKPFNNAERMLRAAVGRRFAATLLATGSDRTPVDAVWAQKGVCVGCSEHKVRTHSRELMRAWGDTYLITAQKLTDGLAVSRLLSVPFYVAALLLPDDVCYLWHITDAGSWEQRKTATQNTCEGGVAVRENAFLDFSTAESFPLRPLSLLLRNR